MKNLFFALVFMLVGTFAFANTGVFEKESFKAETTKKVELAASAKEWHCFDFNDSCGGSWMVCHNGVSSAQLISFLWAWDGGC